MAAFRPRIIFCQRTSGAGIQRLVQRLENDGCTVEQTSSVRCALESVQRSLPTAILCEALLDDGTATMLYDLVQRDLPAATLPMFVVAEAANELSIVQRRQFSGAFFSSDEGAVTRLIRQVAGAKLPE